jgi:hypothetical protein
MLFGLFWKRKMEDIFDQLLADLRAPRELEGETNLPVSQEQLKRTLYKL